MGAGDLKRLSQHLPTRPRSESAAEKDAWTRTLLWDPAIPSRSKLPPQCLPPSLPLKVFLQCRKDRLLCGELGEALETLRKKNGRYLSTAHCPGLVPTPGTVIFLNPWELRWLGDGRALLPRVCFG